MKIIIALLLSACGLGEERNYSCELLTVGEVAYTYWSGTPDDVEAMAHEWVDACAKLSQGSCLAACVPPWRPGDEEIQVIVVTEHD